jgi:DNA-binding PucR family transcriptional regulator
MDMGSWHTSYMDIFALMAQIADRVEADLDAVIAEMDAAIIGTIPAIAADPAIAAEASASSRGNVRRYLAVARRAADPPPPDVPPEALDFARTVVRRGIESDVVYQGYRRGQQTLWRIWMNVAEEVTSSGRELAAVLDTSLDLLFRYVDDILGAVIAEMQHEREQVLGGALARRAETIRLILDGAPLDASAASQRLGYDLARRHTALVLWTETPAPGQAALEATALAVARAAGVRQPLMLSAGVTALWAWIGSDGAPAVREPADADPRVRVAVGPTRGGIAGFRRSHEAALAIQRLLAGNSESGAFATYDDLEITALAAQDEQRAAEFVNATLGPLAEDTASAARLRETLRVYLDEGDSAARSAERLHAHRNTILQRIGRATELLGYAPGERRLALALALELRRRLGSRDPRHGPNPLPIGMIQPRRGHF